MSWWRDIFRQCVFMSFFIIPIPIGSYTIHSGSSAAVALISHLALSFLIPLAYVGMKEATFGPKQARISRISFVIAWLGTSSCRRSIQCLYGADLEDIFILGMAYYRP